MATILYFGERDHGATSAHRAQALERLGHTVIVRDARTELLANQAGQRYREYLNYRTGYRLVQPRVERWLAQVLAETPTPDVIWIDGGELFGRQCLQLLRQLNRPVVLLNVDDPTGTRDGRRFDMVRQNIPAYDLCVVVREESRAEFEAMGAKRVLHVYRSYDEVAHRPFANDSEIPADYRSDVAFIGTWMQHEKRDEFVLELLQQGVPVSIWGDRWPKSPHWPALKHAYRGGALSGRNYVAAIQGAKLCLGLLSKGNRDLHTQRSSEIPFAGGLLCAQRTTEHQHMYAEGEEAVFWSTTAECAEVCKKLLGDDTLRERVRRAGMRRIRQDHAGNEDVCQRVLDLLQVA